jgi:hypothetical protein
MLVGRICTAAGKTASLGTPASVVGKEEGCGLYSYISGVVEGDSTDPELLATIAWWRNPISTSLFLPNQVRRRQANEFTGSDDLCTLPECWEVLLIARYQIVGAGSIGTFHKDIVFGIARHFEVARWLNNVAAILDELK